MMIADFLPNIPRIHTAVAEWGACLLYICQYQKRVKGVRLYAAIAAALLVQACFLVATDTLPVALWIPCMAAAVLLMFLFILVCCNAGVITCCYCTVRAFLLAEFAASLEWLLYLYSTALPAFRNPLARSLYLVVVCLAVYVAMYRLERRPGAQMLHIKPKELWSALIIAVASFAISNLSFVFSNSPFSSTITSEIYKLRTIIDLAGVAMLYAYHTQLGELHTQQELNALESVLQNQYAQYRQSRESIDMINRKYHDLKHQIAVLRAENDPEKRSAFLDGMENEIRMYEAQNKTGNPVLDVVLTGKSMYCAKHGIGLTCVADGALLSFMGTMDICTVFGNLLDNAIECELKIQNKQKRLIHLEVFSQREFLMIRCENYCEEDLSFQDDLPISTKGDMEYHGYGIKSIRYTARKYGGSATIAVRDNWFQMNILIPLPSG